MSLVGEKDSEFGGTKQFEDREKLTNLMRPSIKFDVPTSCNYRTSDELSLGEEWMLQGRQSEYWTWVAVWQLGNLHAR